MSEVVFISDVHLNPSERHRTRLLLQFLEEVGSKAEAIYILGDLFDYWVGPRQARLPEYKPVLNSLKSTSSRGVSVNFLHGNRDFAVSDEFEREYGVRVLGEEHVIELGGKVIYLTHGDLLWTKDTNYRRYRAFIRDRKIVEFMRAMPLGLTGTVARWIRRNSERAAKRRMSRGWKIDLECVDGYTPILESGVDIIICGHAHERVEKTFRSGSSEKSIYILGAWEETGSYVSWLDGVMALKTYEPGEEKATGRREKPTALLTP